MTNILYLLLNTTPKLLLEALQLSAAGALASVQRWLFACAGLAHAPKDPPIVLSGGRICKFIETLGLEKDQTVCAKSCAHSEKLVAD